MLSPFILPPPVSFGDTVGIVAPSSALARADAERLDQAIELLERWGLRVKLADNIGRRHLYLSGDDAERLSATQALLLDPSVAAVCCLRGGYGALRLLSRWLEMDWSAVAPKRVVGLSDATVLLNVLQQRAGWVVFHGPNIASSQLHALEPEALGNQASLQAALFEPRPVFQCALQPRNAAASALLPTQAPLVGGNLSLLAALLGSKAALQPAGCWLFLEEVGEAPYRIDRLWTQLNNAGFGGRLAGVVLGDFHRCDNDQRLLESVLDDLFAQSPVPLFSGLPSGHGPLCRTAPLGLSYRLSLQPDRRQAQFVALSA